MKKFVKIAVCALLLAVAHGKMVAAELSERSLFEVFNVSGNSPALTTPLRVNPAMITTVIFCSFRPPPKFDWTLRAPGGSYGIQGGDINTDLVWGRFEQTVPIPFHNFATGLAGIVVVGGLGIFGLARRHRGSGHDGET